MEDFISFLKKAKKLQAEIEQFERQGLSSKNKTENKEARNNFADTKENKNQFPYLSKNNDLIIPHNTELKYRWWQGGQSIFETLLELGAGEDILDRYVANWRERLERKRWGN